MLILVNIVCLLNALQGKLVAGVPSGSIRLYFEGRTVNSHLNEARPFENPPIKTQRQQSTRLQLQIDATLTFRCSRFQMYPQLGTSVNDLSNPWIIDWLQKCTQTWSLLRHLSVAQNNSPTNFFCVFFNLLETNYYYAASMLFLLHYTECPRRNVQDFVRVFLMLKYTDITQNTYVQS